MSSRDAIHQKFNEALKELASCDFPQPFPDIFPVTKTEKFVTVDMNKQTGGMSVHGHVEEVTDYIQTGYYLHGILPCKMKIIIEEPRLDQRADERVYEFKVNEDFAIDLITTLDKICDGSKAISDQIADNNDIVATFKKV